MDWSAQIFGYCERGGDPSLWAEPINAVSNVSFLLAAYFALSSYRKRGGGRDLVTIGLIALTGLIGGGSFLFHTFATRWSAFADVLPIVMFTLIYLGIAMRRFAAARASAILFAMAALLAAVALAGAVPCPHDLLPRTVASGRPCLNGSLFYLPACVAVTGMAVYLAARGHAAAGYLAKASVLLALSLALRAVDIEVCADTELLGSPRGTHVFWHLLNGLVLYALLRAAIDSGPLRGLP